MKNRGSTPIFTNLVGVHPRNIHTKFEENLCSSLDKSPKTKKVHVANDDDRHRVIASHTHSLSVTDKMVFYSFNFISTNHISVCHMINASYKTEVSKFFRHEQFTGIILVWIS